LVRNGTVYRSNPTPADICVLNNDGRMVTSSPEKFNAQHALDDGAIQTWVFGPKLLDDNGKAQTEFILGTIYAKVTRAAPSVIMSRDIIVS
jgi:hypothetical protein